ncbi:Hint domain-containing protein [Methylocystis heyeri]|nr:Hint domain-containing protein [Methylocystis heyeri]
MDVSDKGFPSAPAQSKRKFLKSYGQAVGALLASTALSIGRARAEVNYRRYEGPHSGSGGHCFLEGTSIRTVDGDRRIEDLKPGDLLPTLFGGTRAIQWIGRYSRRKTDPSRPWAKDFLPVRIARSALAENVPHADLYVTQGHAIFVDGALAPAGELVNGATISLYDAAERDELAFFHIKLDRHDVIYAEGAPVESLQRVDENAVNFADYYRIFGAPRMDEALCAPLLSLDARNAGFRTKLWSALAWPARHAKLDEIRNRLERRCASLALGQSTR